MDLKGCDGASFPVAALLLAQGRVPSRAEAQGPGPTADPISLLPVLNGQAALYLLAGVLALVVLTQPGGRGRPTLEPVSARSR